MGLEERLQGVIRSRIAELVARGALPPGAAEVTFQVERPKRAEHGDLATNVALSLQKLAGRPPREVAALLAPALGEHPDIARVDVAGPGFLNLTLAPAPFHHVLAEVIVAGDTYGRAAAATGERVLVEFVSANPTGPLLISHGRGAILGDAVATLLEATGHRVTREYYINDHGNQVRLFARSVLAAARGEAPPEGGYGGGYVRELAGRLSLDASRSRELEANLGAAEGEAFVRRCVLTMLDGAAGSSELRGIRRTLVDLGIHFDVWSSEEALHRARRVDRALEELDARGFLERREGALFFRSTELGDDKDRVVKKSDGDFTYFASDIAYHAEKMARGYERLINVLGADHHGYVPRLRGVIAALGLPAERFEPLVYQLVHLLRDGKPYKMGKRLGNLITLDEVLEEIDEAAGRAGAGRDALRFFYLARRADTPIELDLELAKRASLDNPVFYLQYGHARLCSIRRRASERFGLETPREARAAWVERVTHPDELAILARLGRFPATVREAAALREPHRIVFYLQELSQAFQSYFTRLKVEGDSILPMAAHMAQPGWETRWDRDKTLGRLLWIEAIRVVYAAGLRLLGITPLERMERAAEDASVEVEG